MIGAAAEIRHQDGSVEQVTLLKQRSWSAPLPAPDDMVRYEQIIPGAAERILRMAEREQEHQISTEASIVRDNGRLGLRGQ